MYGHVCTVPFDDRAPGHPARVRAYLNKIISVLSVTVIYLISVHTASSHSLMIICVLLARR